MSLFGQISSSLSPISGNKGVEASSPTPVTATDLKNGSTVSGTVKNIDGNDVTIKLPDGRELQAKLDGGLALKEGQNVTFGIRSGSDARIALTPLYTNMSQGITAQNALASAGMAVNSDTLQMTLSMMDQGMSIDRSSLGEMYRLMNSLPASPEGGMLITPKEAVEMKALGFNINEETALQFHAFKNYENLIGDSIESIADQAMDLYTELTALGDKNADTFLGRLTEMMIKTSDPSINAGAQTLQETEGPDGTVASQITGAENSPEQVITAGSDNAEKIVTDIKNWVAGELPEAEAEDNAAQINNQAGEEPVQTENADAKIQAESGLNRSSEEPAVSAFKERLIAVLNRNGAPTELVKNLSETEMSFKDVLRTVHALNEEMSEGAFQAKDMKSLEADIRRLFSGTEFKKVISEAFRQELALKPEEAADKANIDKLYTKLQSDVREITGMLSEIARPDSALAGSIKQLDQNLDFMNQLNQTAQYVQIPLKMAGGTATGDLYVYSDKKSLAAKDGSVSALLHLDMEHLGPVDVYAAIKDSGNVNTRFYLADDEMIDFIAEHIHILTERLESKGYTMNTSFSKREELGADAGSSERMLKDPLSAGAASSMISAKRFDMRA